MKDIYVDTGALSDKLLNKTIEKMKAAQKKMGYNYSADAYLEVAIENAKYDSPTGRQRLFTSAMAESAGSLAGDIDDVVKNLSELKKILQNGPDALCEIDAKQKGEITSWWTRTSYHISSAFSKKENTVGEETSVFDWYSGPYEDIVYSYRWEETSATEAEIKKAVRDGMDAGLKNGNITEEVRRRLQQLYDEKKIVEQTKLKHNMNVSLRQGDYAAYTKPWGYNVGCCAMSYAIAVSIVEGRAVDPTKYWYEGRYGYSTYFTDAPTTWVGFDPNAIYSALQEGKPTMVHYNYANGDGEHWVVVVGVREGANVNNLSASDLIVIDPAYGDERLLTESANFNLAGVDGGWRVG